MRESILQDLRFGLRLLRRQPAFAAAIVISLALGVGSATAVFTLLDAVLWRPIQVEEPDRLVSFYGTLRTPSGEYGGSRSFSYEDFADIRGRNTFLSSTALWQWQPLYRTGASHSEEVVGTFVSWEYFETLGLRPSLGRLLQRGDADTLRDDRLVVLSYGYWRSSFAGEPSVLVRRLILNGQDFEIVGVAPRGFKGLDLQVTSDVFIPVSMYPQIGTFAHLFDNREVALFRVSGRLAAGVSLEEADRRIMSLVRGVVEGLGPDFEKLGARALPLQEASLRPVDRSRYESYGRTLMLTSSLLLLVACCNVANLLLLRGLERAPAAVITRP